jgi:hypothetical protein
LPELNESGVEFGRVRGVGLICGSMAAKSRERLMRALGVHTYPIGQSSGASTNLEGAGNLKNLHLAGLPACADFSGTSIAIYFGNRESIVAIKCWLTFRNCDVNSRSLAMCQPQKKLVCRIAPAYGVCRSSKERHSRLAHTFGGRQPT